MYRNRKGENATNPTEILYFYFTFIFVNMVNFRDFVKADKCDENALFSILEFYFSIFIDRNNVLHFPFKNFSFYNVYCFSSYLFSHIGTTQAVGKVQYTKITTNFDQYACRRLCEEI